MKRAVFALCAGLLLLGLMPGATLAIATPIYLDQWNAGHTDNGSWTFAQTFTAGQSGTLSEVDLCLATLNVAGGTLSVSIYPTDLSGTPVTTGTALATSGIASVPYNVTTCGWVSFSFASPPSVTAETMYAIVFDARSDPNALVYAFGSSGNNYSRGAAWIHNPSWASQSNPDDFAFRTFLEESITTTLAWDKPQVTAGTGTSLKLTVTIAFGNDGEADNYTVLLGGLPSWYTNPTPPTIACSWGACDLVTIQGVAGITVPASNPGATLTVTLQGTATPATADVGTPGAAHGTGCILSVRAGQDVVPGAQPAQQEISLCSDGTASVAVVAPGATPVPVTPPPTSTHSGSSSEAPGGFLWFLAIGLVACFGGLILLVKRGRQRVS